ncbi:22155_t:CDS:2 [Gigaspora margarita]|uniref:22155_t:CDS:1 n=1 Tax=Gigaspora margarita TaxID=4874 RepID=A0ABN7VMT6_GIGMA|nr:22155_t:CDS:2 [Gigaspora margarita]
MSQQNIQQIYLKSGVDKLCSSCYNQIADSYRHQKSTINRIKKSNSSMDLMEIIDSRSNSPITLMETNNLVNLIEVIKTQKEELIYENKLNEINQQITNIEISITDSTISIDKENFN